MVRAVRADGGTATEHVFFALYALLLILAFATTTMVAGAVARRLVGGRAGQTVAVSLATLAMVAVLADIVTFSVLGLHPYGSVTWAGVASEDIARVPPWMFAGAVLLIVAIVAGNLALWRRAEKMEGGPRWRAIEAWLPTRAPVYLGIALVAFLALDRADAERVVPRAALPFYALWLAPARALPDARPAFPLTSGAATPAVRFARTPDIVVLMADSFRWDVVSPEGMPFLSRLATSASCTSAPRHYAGGHTTQLGTFSLLYAIDGYAFLPFMQEGRGSAPLEGLRSAGYRLEGYDAAGVLGYAIPPVRTSQFNRFETIEQDSIVIQRILSSLRSSDEGPRFLFGFLRSTHAGYTYPPEWNRFPTGDEPSLTPRIRWFNHYRNSAAYVDSLIARVHRELEAPLGRGDAILIVTGDHGEEFWEYGLTGHAAARFEDVRTRVPLIACFPGIERMRPVLSSHADVLPTVFDLMGGSNWDTTRVTGRSLLTRADYPTVALAAAGFPTQSGAFALVTPTHKFWVHLAGPRLDSVRVDRVTNTLDVTIPMTAAARQDFDRAVAAYVRRQKAVLRLN